MSIEDCEPTAEFPPGFMAWLFKNNGVVRFHKRRAGYEREETCVTVSIQPPYCDNETFSIATQLILMSEREYLTRALKASVVSLERQVLDYVAQVRS
jgi:hypothetical protein